MRAAATVGGIRPQEDSPAEDRAVRLSWSKTLALGALAGFAIFSVGVLALHLAQPDLHPATYAISYYVHGPYGSWLTIGLVGLGAGSLALVGSLSLVPESRSPLGQCLLLLWAASVLAGAAFPADRIELWDTPSTVGYIHGISAMIGFAALPLASLVLTPALGPRLTLSFLPVLTVASLACLLFVLFWPTVNTTRPPIGLGFTQRFVLSLYVGWLATVAIAILRPSGARAPVLLAPARASSARYYGH